MDCTVCIPIGPGHETSAVDAVRSVSIAFEWPGRFDRVCIKTVDDTEGKIGRSVARNRMAREAGTEWLFFLDADDYMVFPGLWETATISAFQAVDPHLDEHDAVWGAIWESWKGAIYQRPQAVGLDSYEKFISIAPFKAVQMGHFVRREAFVEFDEKMDIGEDYEYYLRMWRDFRCIKIREPLMLNIRGNHSTGPRSGTGRDWNKVTDALLEDARRRNSEASFTLSR